MRKIFNFMMMTADGYYEGPDQEFDWPNVDDEFNEFAVEQLGEVDTLLFGRRTYETMAAYWPTPEAEQTDPMVAGRMNSIAKLVVSRTLDKVEWANSRLITGDVARELTRFKQLHGRDIVIFGSSDLTVNLLKMGLIDELRIIVNPVILGAGKSVFRTADERIGLEHLKTRTFKSGNVLIYYRPVAG
jgi:dihydrofolate reductase